jgi:DNA-binding response OmpR family regulator
MKHHILVVDDEESIQNLLVTYFRRKGYKVSVAGTSEEAKRLVDEVPLNLIVLDIRLAGEDGLELLKTLRVDHPKLPIIILTGLGFDDDLLDRALKNGASGYTSKTLPLDLLLMEVHRVLKPIQTS